MEEDIKVRVCRLCFNLILDKGFSSIKDSIKDMLQIITTDVDLDATYSPVMCLECSKSLQEMFNFKTNFFECEENIESKIVNVKHKKLNLRDIMNEDPKHRLTKNNKLCRTCLKTIEGNTFISINKPAYIYLSSMLDCCLPELDLNVTSDPVMCQTCYKTLQKMSHFKAMCKKNENRIDAYCSRMCSSLPSSLPKKVHLHSVLQYLFNPKSKSDIFGGKVVKTEHVEVDAKVKNKGNLDLGKEHHELKDHPEYVMVKTEPDEQIVTQQIKKELTEEFSGVENNCLESVMIKMESVNDECGIGQNPIELVKNRTDLKNLTKQLDGKARSKNKLSNPRSQSRRPGKWLKQNKPSNRTYHILHCSECDFKTKYKCRLRHHLVTIHDRKDMIHEKKFYKCDKCDFTTKFDIDLTRHMLSHIKPEVLRCPRCVFSTNQNSELTKHILFHVSFENIDRNSCLELLKETQQH